MSDGGERPAVAWQQTVEDIVKNAQVACDEARRRIAGQAADAAALETKAAALVTIVSAAVGVMLSRTSLTSPLQYASAGLAALYVILSLLAAFQAIRPRSDFAYGAHPPFLAALVPDYPHWSVMQQLAVTLAQAGDQNRTFLGVKQTWYERALVSIPFIAVGVGAMAYTGALR